MTTPTILTPTCNGAIPAVPGIRFTLTNGALTFTDIGTGTSSGQAFGDNPLSSGSFYFEATLNAFSGTNSYYFGVCPSTGLSATAGVLYSSVDYCVVGNNANSQVVKNGGAAGIQLGAPSAGDVIGIAVSLPNLIWFRLNGGEWNDSSTADPATGVGGVSLSGFPTPLVPFVSGYEGTSEITFNFGQNAFVHTPPALFGDWPGAEQITITSVSLTSGSPMVIVGTTTNGIASALDYSIDGGTTWAACTAYTAEASWTAEGPTFNAAYGAIIIRDHTNTSIISPPVTFSLTPSAPFGSTILFTDTFMEGGPAAMIAAGYSIEPGVSDALQPWATGGTLSIGVKEANGYFPSGYAVHQLARSSEHVLWQFSYQVGDVMPSNGSVLPDPSSIGLSPFTNNASDDPYYITVTFCRNTGYPSPVQNGVGLIAVNGVTTSPVYAEVPNSGFMSIAFDKYASTNTMRVVIKVNGGILFDSGVVTDAIGHISEFSLIAQEEQLAASATFRMLVSNLVVYDTTPVAEALVITSAGGIGANVALAGTNAGTIAVAMDYALDAGSWTPLVTYTPGADWTGTGPVVVSGTHTIQVRDHTVTSVTSNIETFTIGLGIYVWDGVKIHS
jgi:hypothetical protein